MVTKNAKMYKTPTGARFIVTSKNCSTEPMSYVISKVFKMIFDHVESFIEKVHFTHALKSFGL